VNDLSKVENIEQKRNFTRKFFILAHSTGRWLAEISKNSRVISNVEMLSSVLRI